MTPMQDGPASVQIRVLVADEISRVVRDLQALQQTSDEIGICGLARTPSALLEEARRLQPDVILINEQYFGVDILFAVEELVHIAPGATIVEMTKNPAVAEKRGRRAGIQGFVTSDASTEEIVDLIFVLRGKLPRSARDEPDGVSILPEDRVTLTPEPSPLDDDASTVDVSTPAAWPPAPRVTDQPAPAEAAPAPDLTPAGGDDFALPTWGVSAGEVTADSPPAWGAGAAEPAADAEPAWGVVSESDPQPAATTFFAPAEAPEPHVAESIPPADAPEISATAELPASNEAESPFSELNGSTAELEPIQPVTPRRIRRGSRAKAEIFFVLSGKGGVGKSTVAANLGVALAEDRDSRVAVVDLDLQFGDIGVMYGIQGKHSIEALADQGEQVDADYLEDTMSDGPAGTRVLLAPPSPELADLVTAANLRSILRELSKGYDYVVVDGPAHLEERTLEVIELADQLIVVTAYNVTSVKDTKVMLKVLSSLGVDKERISVVLNQTRPKTNFTREQVEESLRFRVVAQLPYDPRVVDDAADHGKPFVISEPKAEISRQIRTLVDFLSPPGESTGEGAPAGGKDKVNRRRFSLGRG